MRRAIELAPAEHNTKLQAMTKVLLHDRDHGEWTDAKTGEQRRGKASLVFANSAAAVRLIQEHLQKQGLRAETITGATSPDDMRRTLARFPRPETGKAREADVLVGTSAIEAGLNAQFAQSTHHFDVPLTEKSFNQRSGRAYRQNQRADVDNHTWHTDSDYDRAARLRLQRKTGLANVFQTTLPHLDDSGLAATYQAALAAKHQGDEPEAMAAK
jgi:superfamily II DNA/RNA helicase